MFEIDQAGASHAILFNHGSNSKINRIGGVMSGDDSPCSVDGITKGHLLAIKPRGSAWQTVNLSDCFGCNANASVFKGCSVGSAPIEKRLKHGEKMPKGGVVFELVFDDEENAIWLVLGVGVSRQISADTSADIEDVRKSGVDSTPLINELDGGHEVDGTVGVLGKDGHTCVLHAGVNGHHEVMDPHCLIFGCGIGNVLAEGQETVLRRNHHSVSCRELPYSACLGRRW